MAIHPPEMWDVVRDVDWDPLWSSGSAAALTGRHLCQTGPCAH